MGRRYYKGLAQEFEEVAASEDRRLDFEQFFEGAPRMGLELSEAEARALFDRMDAGGEGLVRFEEFCAFMGRLKAEHRDRRDRADAVAERPDERPRKMARREGGAGGAAEQQGQQQPTPPPPKDPVWRALLVSFSSWQPAAEAYDRAGPLACVFEVDRDGVQL